MSTDKTEAGMPNQINPREVMWGRQGLGPDFFGPELIAEALWEVFKTAELDKLRNFTTFPRAMVTHNFESHGTVRDVEATYSSFPPVRLDIDITEYELDQVCGVGIYGISYGLTPRTVKDLDEVSSVQWYSSEWWDLVIQENNKLREKDPKRLPYDQIARMCTQRIFITRSKKIVVSCCYLNPDPLCPNLSFPHNYKIDNVELMYAFDLSEVGVSQFCQTAGAKAGMALLKGVKTQLQSSIYQVRQELKENEKAHNVAEGLLKRI